MCGNAWDHCEVSGKVDLVEQQNRSLLTMSAQRTRPACAEAVQFPPHLTVYRNDCCCQRRDDVAEGAEPAEEPDHPEGPHGPAGRRVADDTSTSIPQTPPRDWF